MGIGASKRETELPRDNEGAGGGPTREVEGRTIEFRLLTNSHGRFARVCEKVIEADCDDVRFLARSCLLMSPITALEWQQNP